MSFYIKNGLSFSQEGVGMRKELASHKSNQLNLLIAIRFRFVAWTLGFFRSSSNT